MNEWLAFYLTYEGQQLGILIYLIVIFAITLLNTGTMRCLDSYPHPIHWPSVSVLIPARNEETTIRRCVESLLAQDYPHFDLWVLDDLSTDRTAAILNELAARHAKLRVLSGQPLPVGWLGKPWACHQLAAASAGELLLFVDSDTWHHPNMVRDAVSAMNDEQADLLSVIPNEVTQTLAEKLSVPLVSWSLFSHFPLALCQRLNRPSLAVAIGQWMLFQRISYQRLGGHEIVRAEITEDLAFAQQVVRANGRWLLLNGVSRVYCRMYHCWSEVWHGFGKNLFPSFGDRWWLYIFVWGWVGYAYLLPFVALIWPTISDSVMTPWLSLINIGLSIAIWSLYVWRLRASNILILLYPVVIISMLLLAAHSLKQRWRGDASWKGRVLPKV